MSINGIIFSKTWIQESQRNTEKKQERDKEKEKNAWASGHQKDGKVDTLYIHTYIHTYREYVIVCVVCGSMQISLIPTFFARKYKYKQNLLHYE